MPGLDTKLSCGASTDGGRADYLVWNLIDLGQKPPHQLGSPDTSLGERTLMIGTAICTPIGLAVAEDEDGLHSSQFSRFSRGVS